MHVPLGDRMAEEQPRDELAPGLGYEIVEFSLEDVRRLFRFDPAIQVLDAEVRSFGGKAGRDFEAAPGAERKESRRLRLKIAHPLLPRYEPGQLLRYAAFHETLGYLERVARRAGMRSPMERAAIPVQGGAYGVPLEPPEQMPAGSESTT